MDSNVYRDIALDQFEREKLSLEGLERIHRKVQEDFARSADVEKMQERDGLSIAIEIIRKQQSA